MKVSSVLEAMKIPPEVAVSTVRISTGKNTAAEEIDRAVAIISKAVVTLLHG
jgi:cysteine sulfinate desulfinase/cysteine desulfurase-like protein